MSIDFGDSIRGRFNSCTNPGNTGFDFVMVVGIGSIVIFFSLLLYLLAVCLGDLGKLIRGKLPIRFRFIGFIFLGSLCCLGPIDWTMLIGFNVSGVSSEP